MHHVGEKLRQPSNVEDFMQQSIFSPHFLCLVYTVLREKYIL